MKHGSIWVGGALLGVLLVAAGCSDGGSPTTDAGLVDFTVGGSITGLNGNLGLSLNGSPTFVVSVNGSFTAPGRVPDGTSYALTIVSQPVGQSCTVSGGTGTITAGDVVSIAIDCSTNAYTVGGTTAGLVNSGLEITLNGGAALPINSNGTFAFPTPLLYGATFAVAIAEQPTDQTCTVAGGTGTVGESNVTSVMVNCTDNPTVGGSVSGLLGTGLVLQLGGAHDLAISGDGTFAFPAPLVPGTDYAVTVSAQPTSPWQTCVVSNGTGTVGSADVTNVSVDCTTNTYQVSGVVRGLAGTGLELGLGQDSVAVDPPSTPGDDVPFEFTTAIASGSAFDVAITTYPGSPTQACTVTNGSGMIAGSDITNVVIDCGPGYLVRPTVSGLTASGLVLSNNGDDVLPVMAAGTVAFGRPLAPGATYHVEIAQQPTGETCTVYGGAGTVASGNVDSVLVLCGTGAYALGGTVSGLAGAGLVLDDGLGHQVTIAANGDFVFPYAYADASSFAVTVQTQPSNPWQTCTLSNDTGTIASANQLDVAVTCTTNSYTIGGTVTGLAGSGLELEMAWNEGGAQSEILGVSGPFSFTNDVPSGTTVTLSVHTQPTSPWQTCTVDGGATSLRTVTNGNLGDVAVVCTNNQYAVLVDATLMGATGLELRDGTGTPVAVGEGVNTLVAALASGSSYSVSIATHPTPTSECTLTGATGIVGGSAAHVGVVCTPAYSVGGSVTGLAANPVTVRLVRNGEAVEDIVIPSDATSYRSTAGISTGGTYDLSVVTQPSDRYCTVSGVPGTVANADVMDVNIECVPVTVTVRAYGNATSIELLNNGGDATTVVPSLAGTTVVFPTPMLIGATYAVTASASGRHCEVLSGTGTATAPITVTVDCGMQYSVGGTVAVPDSPNASCGLTSGGEAIIQIPVPDSFTVRQAEVAMNLTHTWVGDLQVELASPASTRALVVYRPGGTNAVANAGRSADLTGGIFDFANWNTANLGAITANTASGSFYPMASRTGDAETDLGVAFGGQDAAGTWSVIGTDWCNGDLGTITSPVLTLYQFAN